MTSAVKTGLIIALVVTLNGDGMAEGKKSISGHKMTEQKKTASTSGQGNISLKEETNDHFLFPLSKAILNEL
ncbi:MAG: hypothetical protein ACM3H8_03575 [Sphingobacteriales bacterium]